MTDIENDEIVELWKALHKFNVEYILVGGFAVNFHGYSRVTGDLDIWVKDSAENREKMKRAFSEIFAQNFDHFLTTQFVPGWSGFKIEDGFEIDIMTDLKGLPQEKFEECYGQSRLENILGIPVRFLHYNDLIRSKEAAGRPKDLLDIEELKRLNS